MSDTKVRVLRRGKPMTVEAAGVQRGDTICDKDGYPLRDRKKGK